jgi:hypothetical protein
MNRPPFSWYAVYEAVVSELQSALRPLLGLSAELAES